MHALALELRSRFGDQLPAVWLKKKKKKGVLVSMGILHDVNFSSRLCCDRC